MRPFFAVYHKTVGLDFDPSACFHKLAIELLGLCCVEAMQLGGQPPVAPIGKDRQGDVHIHIQAHLAGETVEMKEIDTDAQTVFHAVASGIAGDELPGAGVEVIGHQQRELTTPQAVEGELPYGPLIATEGHSLIDVADVLVPTFGDIKGRLAPGVGWQPLQTPQQGGSPAPNRHKPDAALIDPGQCGIRHQFGVEVEPLRIAASNSIPEFDETHQLPRLLSTGEIRVSIA